MPLCIKCKLEHDERTDCETCRHTEDMFRAWTDVTRMGITSASGTGGGADFDEDIYEKHPILTTLKYEPCNNIYQLERYIRLRLENLLKNRQKYYKKKKGMSGWDLRYSSTSIWKKDTTGKRKAPLVSATCFDIGEKMKGKGGIMYIVKRKKDGSQFWTRYRPSLLSFYALHHGIYHGR